jgi:hypothetical protein
LRLLNNNVVMSSLHSWWHDFRSFDLFHFDNLRSFVSEGYSLDIDSFIAIQEAVREKTVSLMKHVWFRGAMLILKKFKFLKKRIYSINGKWTYQGFVELEKNEARVSKDEDEYSPLTFANPYSSVDKTLSLT